MYETNNDLSETTRRSVIEILNEHLADAIDLQLQAKQAHWNIKGPNFVGLHELFDQIAAQAREYADEIAERGVALGGVARGTLQWPGCPSALPSHSSSYRCRRCRRGCPRRSPRCASRCRRPDRSG